MEAYKYLTTVGGEQKEGMALRATSHEIADQNAWNIQHGLKRVQLDGEDGQPGEGAWEPADRCVYDKRRGVYRRKIDFCMDYLGPAAVTAMIRDIKLPEKAPENQIGQKLWAAEYRKLLEKMVAEVQAVLGAKK